MSILGQAFNFTELWPNWELWVRVQKMGAHGPQLLSLLVLSILTIVLL